MTAAFASPRRFSRRRFATTMLASGLLGLLVGCGGAESADDAESTVTADEPAAAGVRPEGFTTVVAEVTSADGEVCNVCLWLADTADERSRGLMGVTDLGEAVGMAFRWDEPVQSRFVMIDTPTPLSIAWFGADGSFVSETDMEPCLDTDPAQCARYSAAAEYTLAVETFDGGLAGIGIGPGSTIVVDAASESTECPSDV